MTKGITQISENGKMGNGFILALAYELPMRIGSLAYEVLMRINTLLAAPVVKKDDGTFVPSSIQARHSPGWLKSLADFPKMEKSPMAQGAL